MRGVREFGIELVDRSVGEAIERAAKEVVGGEGNEGTVGDRSPVVTNGAVGVVLAAEAEEADTTAVAVVTAAEATAAFLTPFSRSQLSKAKLNEWETESVIAWAVFFFGQRKAWHSMDSLSLLRAMKAKTFE